MFWVRGLAIGGPRLGSGVDARIPGIERLIACIPLCYVVGIKDYFDSLPWPERRRTFLAISMVSVPTVAWGGTV